MEVRHSKEVSDAEVRITEEFSGVRSKQTLAEHKLRESQREAYTDEKENILSTRTKLKLMENTVENHIELTRVQAQHRIQLRQALRDQEARRGKRIKSWSVILGRDVSIQMTNGSGSTSAGTSGQSSMQRKSVGVSQAQSKSTSRRGSDGKISEQMQEFRRDDASKVMDDHASSEDAADLAMMTSTELEKQQDLAKKKIHELTTKLRAFQQINEKALLELMNKQEGLLNAKEEDSQKFMMVLISFNSSRKWNGGMKSSQRTCTRLWRPKYPRL
jgi:hypothetical protein